MLGPFIIVLTADEAEAVIAALETMLELPLSRTPPSAKASVRRNWQTTIAKIKREQCE